MMIPGCRPFATGQGATGTELRKSPQSNEGWFGNSLRSRARAGKCGSNNPATAVVIDERDLTAGRLAAVTRELLADRARRDAMATAMRGLAQPDAARRIVDCVLELAGVAPARAH